MFLALIQVLVLLYYGWNVDYFGTLNQTTTDSLYNLIERRYLPLLERYRAVSGKYRMPMLNELYYGSNDPSTKTIDYNKSNWQSATTIEGYWTRLGSVSNPNDWNNINSTVTDPTGRYAGLRSGANYSGYTQFPSAGYRDWGSGQLMMVGNAGYYWGSSPGFGATYADSLIFGLDAATWGGYKRPFAFAVRCLLDQ
jgi:hypothetical protein